MPWQCSKYSPVRCRWLFWKRSTWTALECCSSFMTLVMMEQSTPFVATPEVNSSALSPILRKRNRVLFLSSWIQFIKKMQLCNFYNFGDRSFLHMHTFKKCLTGGVHAFLQKNYDTSWHKCVSHSLLDWWLQMVN